MGKQFGGVISAVNGQVAANVEKFGILVAQISTPSAFAGANLIFEGSNNSTNGVDGDWVNINAARSNANVAELNTGVLGAAPAYAWEISVVGYRWFRIRATAL